MEIKKVTIKDISIYLNKKENTISGWSSKHPTLLELVKIGAFCKKNNLDIEKTKKLIEIKEAVKGAGEY
jgi:hypothetical protein